MCWFRVNAFIAYNVVLSSFMLYVLSRTCHAQMYCGSGHPLQLFYEVEEGTHSPYVAGTVCVCVCIL